MLICQVVEGSLLLQEKFLNCVLDEAFYTVMNKNLENFQSISYIKFVYFTNQTTYARNFFTRNTTLYLSNFSVN